MTLEIKNVNITKKVEFSVISTEIEQLQCSIYRTNIKNVVFNCGHLICGSCVKK